MFVFDTVAILLYQQCGSYNIITIIYVYMRINWSVVEWRTLAQSFVAQTPVVIHNSFMHVLQGMLYSIELQTKHEPCEGSTTGTAATVRNRNCPLIYFFWDAARFVIYVEMLLIAPLDTDHFRYSLTLFLPKISSFLSNFLGFYSAHSPPLRYVCYSFYNTESLYIFIANSPNPFISNTEKNATIQIINCCATSALIKYEWSMTHGNTVKWRFLHNFSINERGRYSLHM